jgi:ethanolamine utilization protein EutA
MKDTVKLIGLDFGSTTSSAVVASARLCENRLSGRRELREVTPTYRSELVFTPFIDEEIDVAAVRRLVEDWLAAGAVQPGELFGGGALVTGLAAARPSALTDYLRTRLGEAVIATADDPGLESFVAFMGSCAAQSRAEPGTPLLNLDLGGGTTNLALGLGGEVLRTGCLHVGARHLRFAPGSYRLTGGSALGLTLLDHFGIAKRPGAELSPAELAPILDYYVELLTAACRGARGPLTTALGQKFEPMALTLPEGLPPAKLAFSGGVGALIHARLAGDRAPPTTQYGDLGPHLAERIVQSGLLAAGVVTAGQAGRATVYGLLAHSTVVSGSSVFLARPETLPLRELPILGRISTASTPAQLHDALQLVRQSPRGGALRVQLGSPTPAHLRALGAQLRAALQALAFPPTHPIVLLLEENLGRVLGGYITDWRPPTANLLLIDEVAVPSARLVQLGRPHEQVIPVSFYGLQS